MTPSAVTAKLVEPLAATAVTRTPASAAGSPGVKAPASVQAAKRTSSAPDHEDAAVASVADALTTAGAASASLALYPTACGLPPLRLPSRVRPAAHASPALESSAWSSRGVATSSIGFSM